MIEERTKPKDRKRMRFVAQFAALCFTTVGGFLATAVKGVPEEKIGELLPSKLSEALSFLVSAELWKSFVPTIRTLCLAFGSAGIIAFGLAWLMTYSPIVRKFLSPFISIMKPIPSIATIAVGTLLLSPSSEYLSFLVAVVGSVWPLTASISDVFQAVPQSLYESIRTLGRSRMHYFSLVLPRVALPGIFDSLRLVAPITLLLVVTSEYFFPSLGGLGALLYEKHSALEYTSVISIIMSMSVVSIMVEAGLEIVEYYVCPWSRKTSNED